MKGMAIVGAAWLVGARTVSAGIAIRYFHGTGELVWTGSQAAAYSVEWAARPDGPWTNSWDGLASQALAEGGAMANAVPMFYRVRGVPSTLLIHGNGAEGSTAITDEYAHVVSVNG